MQMFFMYQSSKTVTHKGFQETGKDNLLRESV